MEDIANKRSVTNTEEAIGNCLDEIRKGVPIKTACRRYGIPRSTVKFRLSSRYKHQQRPGVAPALDRVDEIELVDWVKKMARKGYPVTKYRIMNSVILYLEKHPEKNRFKKGKPSDQWFRCFLNRYRSELSVRKPESVAKASANVTESDIRKWFKEVLEILREEKVEDILSDPRRLLNGDETCFYLDPSVGKVIARRGERNVYKIDQGMAKKNITAMFTCSADGVMYPPMVVLPYKKIPLDVTKSVPAEWGLGKTDSGWMTKECFLKYIKYVLHPQLVTAKLLPVIYFVDGHSSHTAWETAEDCAKLGIILVCLYANCTRILQPLDVAVFKPLKTAWLKVVDDWKYSNPNQHIKTEHFSPLLKKAMKSVDDRIIRNGFQACGLYPFNENNVDYSKCLAHNSCNLVNNSLIENSNELQVSAVSKPVSHLKTFSVNQNDAREVLEMMGFSRRSRYQKGDVVDFISEEDKILAKVYNMLKPMETESYAEDEMIEEYLIDEQNMIEERTEEHVIALDQPVDLFQDFEEKLNDPQPPIEFVQTDELYEEDLKVTPQPSNKQNSALAEFLESPETPKRAGTLRFKHRSPAVLTSRRRLEYHKAKAEEKKKKEEEKHKKAELKKNKKKLPCKPRN